MRAGVGDFVADIPFAAGHPSRPALDRIADGIAALGRPGAAAVGAARPGLPRGAPARPAAAAAAGRAAPVREGQPPAARGRTRSMRRRCGTGSTPPDRPRTRPLRLPTVAPPPDAVGAAGSDAGRADRPRTTTTGPRARRGWRRPAAARSAGPNWPRRVRNTAAGLAAAGVRPGDRVALLVPPSIELTVALYAVLAGRRGDRGGGQGAGAPRHGPGAAQRPDRPPDRRHRRAARCRADAGAGQPDRHPRGLPALRRVARVGAHHARPWQRPAATCRCPAESGPDDEAAVVFTSGATGPAKGVLYRHRQVRAQLRADPRQLPASPVRRPDRRRLRAVRAVRPCARGAVRGAGHRRHQAGHADRGRSGRCRRGHRCHRGLRLTGRAGQRAGHGGRRHAGPADRAGPGAAADECRRAGPGANCSAGWRDCCRTPTCTPRTG